MRLPGDAPFALCLTHDVDRPFKRATHGLFYALQERPGYHLRTALPDRNPYWQFEAIATLEAERGVRSAFYVLDQPSLLGRGPGALLSPTAWIEELGRYDLDRPSLRTALRRLSEGGWEVGLHASLATADDPDRLAREKAAVEAALGGTVRGCRQHHLRLEPPGTWRHQRAAGLRYDASLGSSTEVGFAHGHEPLRPFDDEFLVFPLTAMETALPDPGESFDDARAACESLLAEAAETGAVMTVLWHPRCFATAEFPGYRRLYEWLLDRALELDAWVGPPGELYDHLVEGADRPGSAEDADPDRPESTGDADRDRPESLEDAESNRPGSVDDAESNRPGSVDDAESSRPESVGDADWNRPESIGDADRDRPESTPGDPDRPGSIEDA